MLCPATREFTFVKRPTMSARSAQRPNWLLIVSINFQSICERCFMSLQQPSSLREGQHRIFYVVCRWYRVLTSCVFALDELKEVHKFRACTHVIGASLNGFVQNKHTYLQSLSWELSKHSPWFSAQSPDDKVENSLLFILHYFAIII